MAFQIEIFSISGLAQGKKFIDEHYPEAQRGNCQNHGGSLLFQNTQISLMCYSKVQLKNTWTQRYSEMKPIGRFCVSRDTEDSLNLPLKMSLALTYQTILPMLFKAIDYLERIILMTESPLKQPLRILLLSMTSDKNCLFARQEPILESSKTWDLPDFYHNWFEKSQWAKKIL